MPKRGERQAFKVFTDFPPSDRQPDGGRFLSAYGDVRTADHEARQRARIGGTCHVLYQQEDGSFLRIFIYTPDNVRGADADAELAAIYKQDDILRWYQNRFTPEGIAKNGWKTSAGTPAVIEAPAAEAEDGGYADEADAEEPTRPASETEAPVVDGMTDEELWNSPLGERVRHYADKLLLAEAERIRANRKRHTDEVVAQGLEFGRAIISPLGDPNTFDDDGTPTRADTDPWANWQSTEVTGLRGAVAATDGSRDAVQEAAKTYIARLQSEERTAPIKEPTEAPAAEKKPVTPTDVAGALSYLLTGHAASDRGPFAVHEGDGFHAEPYVLIPLDAMAKVLDEIPESRW